jgi:hypothetical protein
VTLGGGGARARLDVAGETGTPVKTFPGNASTRQARSGDPVRRALPVTMTRVLDMNDPPDPGGKEEAPALP